MVGNYLEIAAIETCASPIDAACYCPFPTESAIAINLFLLFDLGVTRICIQNVRIGWIPTLRTRSHVPNYE